MPLQNQGVSYVPAWASLSLPKLLYWPFCLRFQFPHIRRQSGLPKVTCTVCLQNVVQTPHPSIEVFLPGPF